MQLTCNKCGTVAFGVSRAHAEAEVSNFNKFFHASSQEEKDMYGNRESTIKAYEQCWCGNPYTNFREAKEGDCPDGCTLSPIISDEPGSLV